MPEQSLSEPEHTPSQPAHHNVEPILASYGSKAELTAPLTTYMATSFGPSRDLRNRMKFALLRPDGP